jgi:hypothetical protein
MLLIYKMNRKNGELTNRQLILDEDTIKLKISKNDVNFDILTFNRSWFNFVIFLKSFYKL